jgi:Ca2+-binding RTX toxin-like protein
MTATTTIRTDRPNRQTHFRRVAGGAVVAAVVTAAVLASCAPSGGTVSVSGETITFTARSGKANAVSVTESNGEVLVSDSGDTVSPGTGCSAVDSDTARCPVSSNDTVIQLLLGDGDDRASNDVLLGAVVKGGPGADVLDGGNRPDLLIGEEGNDVLRGHGGGDLLREGETAGAVDAIDADSYVGGDGTDGISYSPGAVAVTVDLDGVADDGRVGEGDAIAADVENVVGTEAGDVLTGGTRANVLRGQSGADRLTGNEGNDTFDGASGNDVLVEGATATATDVLDTDLFLGGPGADTVSYAGAAAVRVDLDDVNDDGRTGEGDNVRSDVEVLGGGAGRDTLIGDADPNTLVGNGDADLLKGGGGADLLGGAAGDDLIDGEAGDDRLFGGSGFDVLSGGEGTDTCFVEADGGSTTGCEA